MFHRSERLFLRPAFPEDWAAIRDGLAADEAIMRNLAHVAWPNAEDVACGFSELQQDPRLPHFLVTLPGVGVIGGAGLAQHTHEHDSTPQLGCWIVQAHRGRGYATEAAGAVLRIARTLGHRRLVAEHFTDHPAAGKVLRKVGFLATGRVTPRQDCVGGSLADTIEYAIDLGCSCECIETKRAA